MDSGNSYCGVKRFDGSEYEVWSTLMEAVLRTKRLHYVLVKVKPSADDKLKKWIEDDESAKATILLALDTEVVKLVLSCQTAKDVWNRLRDVHSQQSDARKMLLQTEFFTTNMKPGSKVSSFVSEIELIARKLRDAGVVLDEDTLISKVVSGLTSDFKHFLSNWMGTPAADRTYANLLPRLLAEETSFNQTGKQVEAIAMEAISGIRRRKFKAKNQKNVECYFCKKKGHLKKDCYQFKRQKEHNNDAKNIAVVAKVNAACASEWLYDSGASFHISKNLEWFVNYTPHSKKIPIQVGNSGILFAIGSGNIKVVSTVGNKKIPILLSDVHYVPDISDNLFSHGAADDKGVSIISRCGKIKMVKDGETIIVGNKGPNNMYILDIEVVKEAKIAKSKRTLEEWHRVLGHPGIEEIKNLATRRCAREFEIVQISKDNERCGECEQGKAHHSSHPESSRERSLEVLHRVHLDLVGPVMPSSLGSHKYFMLARDEYSSYMFVYFMSSKMQALHSIKKFINEASIASQRKVQIMRSDNGTEFKNTAVKLMCEAEGIVQEFSAPFTAQQNGEAERANRTVIESARSMLQSSGLDLGLWGEAVLTAVYLRNRITNTRVKDKTPFELFLGKPPTLSHLIEFGKELQILDSSKGISKFSSKTLDAYMVGYSERINTYRCYNSQTKSVIITSDVVVADHIKKRQTNNNRVWATFLIENHSDSSANVHVADEEQVTGDRSIDLPRRTEEQLINSCTLDLNTLNPIEGSNSDAPTSLDEYLRDEGQLEGRNSNEISNIGGHQTASSQTSSIPSVDELVNSEELSIGQVPRVEFDWTLKNRTKRNVKSKYAKVSRKTSLTEPQSFKEAISGENKEEWKKAIVRELDAHNKNNTWEVCLKPHGINEITAKWIFKIKYDPKGCVEKYKARLVARGYEQVAGIDFEEIFSPVVRTESIRLLFALCAQFNLHFKQFDVKTAFLNGTLKEKIFMSPPEGIKIPNGHTCRLLKSLYGLKQAPRAWNEKFSSMLKTFKMSQLKSDPCVFVGQGADLIILAIYVDDGVIFAKSEEIITSLMEYLMENLEVTVVTSSYFLGLEIVQDRKSSSIFLYQQAYAKRVLEKFNMHECKGAATPLEVGHTLNDPKRLKEEAISDAPYAEAIGSLQYLATGTRPDISYAMSVLCKYMKNPRQHHWKAVKRVLRYIRSTLKFGLLYRAVDQPKVTCYVDADYGGDHHNRRSTTGIISFINTGPVSFKSQQQTTVALSTTEAEYVACSIAVKEIIWLRGFIYELNIPLLNKALLMCDNQSAIRLVKNPEFHHRTKHIDIRYHFTREQYQAGTFEIAYLSTNDQKADLFTKALSSEKHLKLSEEIGCVNIDHV